MSDMLSQLTHEQFEPCLKQTFRATEGPADPQDLELVEVTVVGEPIPDLTNRHAFSLIFEGPRDALLPQAIYRFENETLGPLEFMIVPIAPIGPDERGQRYEAIFN